MPNSRTTAAILLCLLGLAVGVAVLDRDAQIEIVEVRQ